MNIYFKCRNISGQISWETSCISVSSLHILHSLFLIQTLNFISQNLLDLLTCLAQLLISKSICILGSRRESAIHLRTTQRHTSYYSWRCNRHVIILCDTGTRKNLSIRLYGYKCKYVTNITRLSDYFGFVLIFPPFRNLDISNKLSYGVLLRIMCQCVIISCITLSCFV